MKDLTSRIVHSLNESVNTPSVENEESVGVNAPKQVHKCDNCADFYLVDEEKNESICPECGSVGHFYADVKESDEEADPAKISNPRLDEEEEEELRSEAEELVTEGLKLLDRNDYRRFNEGYRPRSRVNSKGELEMMVESNGHVITASRRMTSRQKTAYALSEKYTVSSTSSSSKKNESIKARRQELMMKNECRAVKIQACRLLERMGVKYDYKKFNEGMNKFLNNRKITESIARINEDDEIGASELDKMTPDEIGDQVNNIIKDTGLDVIANDVEIDGDTATVNVRVQDSDEVEVKSSEVQDVLQDVFDTPVEIVGPYESEGDKTIQDLAVIINPDSDVNESDDTCPICGKSECDCDPINENDKDSKDEPKVPTIAECDDGSVKKESLRKRGHRKSRKNESFVEGTGNTPLFALVSNMTVGNKNNAPEFLAHDDSLVTGDQPDAEDKARTFVSYKAAQKYLQDAGLEDDYTPVSISVVQNESIKSEFDSEMSVNEEDDRDLFETEDGTYFEEDDKYFCESIDGTVREIDESEFEDAKATAQEIDKIQESFKKRNAARRRRNR